MNIDQRIALNLSASGIPPRVSMPQGDSNSRTIIAALWDGPQPYSIPDASSVKVRFRKPDGTGGLYDATESGAVVTASGNIVTAPVATQMLAVHGEVQAQIDIFGTATGKAAEKLATFCFIVDVLQSAFSDAEIISSDYFNVVAGDIAKAVSAATKAEEAEKGAVAAKTAAEASATEANKAKVEAETARSGAEAAQKKAQDSQEAASSAAAAALQARNAAEAAQNSAQESKDAAELAKTGAETAQSGAKAAQTAAEQANTDAQTAKTGAETAKSEAVAAQGKAIDAQTAAELAKTAAQEAKAGAEVAQNMASVSQTAAETAKTDAQTAKASAEAAQKKAQDAQVAAENAKTDAQTAKTDAEAAKSGAETSASDAEAWAIGKRNGVDVPESDPAYHNNSKYYKDQSKTYTPGENIDISAENVIRTKAFPCNPNLLDNWYFPVPVDQRSGRIVPAGTQVYSDEALSTLVGNSAYTYPVVYDSGTFVRVLNKSGGHFYAPSSAAVRGYCKPGYTISRWKMDDIGMFGSITINSDKTITISNGAAQEPIWFTQLADVNIVLGTRTASVLVTAITGTVNMYSGTTTGMPLSLNLNAIQSSEDSNIAMRIVVFPNSSVTIRAVKLELGTEQTLAHKEGDTWVLNEIPDYHEQLLRCLQSTADPSDDYANQTVMTNQMVSNPNLLDNWYFANPVDQRKGYVVKEGANIYTDASCTTVGGTAQGGPYQAYAISPICVSFTTNTTYYCKIGDANVIREYVCPNQNLYSIDRWCLLYQGNTAIVNPGNGISLNATDYCQQILHDRIPLNVPLTASVLLQDGRLDSFTFTFATGTVTDAHRHWCCNNLFEIWVAYDIWDTKNRSQFFINTHDKFVDIKAVKLELGSKQTLAHKVGDKWVLNEIPEYAKQLEECQRYFYQAHYTQYQTINMAYEDTAYAFIMLPLPVVMRIDNPVVTQSKPIALGTSEKILVSAEVKGCAVRLGVNYTAINNAQRAVYSYCADPEGVTFTFSADL